MSCVAYSCHFCTIPETTSLQCRNCKATTDNFYGAAKCKVCFSCPYCSNVLVPSKLADRYF